jgi:trehalose-6-phosphate synthase
MLKERNPNLIVAQFWHIPWPNPEVLRGFPWKEVSAGISVLAFHTEHCTPNRLRWCRPLGVFHPARLR